LEKNKNKQTSELTKLNNLEQGAKCPHCFGTIDKQHYSHVVNLHQNKINSLTPKINALQARVKGHNIEIDKFNASLDKLTNLKAVAQHKLRKIVEDIEEAHNEINALFKTQKPDLTSRELVLEEKLVQIKEKIANKERELAVGGPFEEILEVAEADLANVCSQKESQKSKIDEYDELLPYYNWWTKGFDDIRSFIIERIVPSLNARIATWMQYLLGGNIKVTFNKHLDATIESAEGDEYAYFATCGGERKRINLAISQAFAYVMMLSSGTWPSVVFLDEVSDSIDQRGIRSIYNMICELAREKQVFVITHNIHLRQMLDGVDTITVLRENGFTKRIQ
jgi:DNA repair ATPase RecN